jgi:type I restriction enzyme S subunit
MSFPRYSKYKDSGVEWLGQIPEHWQLKPLYGSAVERYESNKGMVEDNLLSLSYGKIVQKDISSNDGLLPESFETYQVVHPGDIVFRLTDLQNDKRSLRSALVEEKGIITSAYLAVTPRGLDSSFTSYLFRAYDVTKVFYSMGGGLRQSMKFSDVKRMPTLIPPLDEQTRIAAFLDQETAKIDALVAEQERLMALLKEKLQAVISHTVTKGLHDQSFPLKRLKFLIDGIETGFTPNSHNSPATTGQCGVLKSGCVNGGIFDPNENKLLADDVDPPSDLEVKVGDVLMSRASGSSELIGSVAQVREQPSARLFLSDKTFRVQVKESSFDAAFFVVAMGSSFLRNQLLQIISGAEGLAKNVAQSDIREFQMPFPSLTEQRAIVTHLNTETVKFDTLTTEAQRAIDLLQERRTALISAAVTGQIDVRQVLNSPAATKN